MSTGAVGRARRGPAALALALVVLAAPAAVSAADDRVLSGDVIRGELTGKQLGGVYPSGVRWTEAIHPDGTSDYQEDGQQPRKGRWWLADADFCFTYGEPGSGGCFQLVKQGRNCYELYYIEPSEAQSSAPRSTTRDWNGKLWRTEEPTTCEMPTV